MRLPVVFAILVVFLSSFRNGRDGGSGDSGVDSEVAHSSTRGIFRYASTPRVSGITNTSSSSGTIY